MKRRGASSSQVERPHFFKIILSHENQLALPDKFVRTYGDYLSSPAILKVPTGLKWEVEIVSRNGRAWFRNGWPSFSDYYSVTLGTFIVFEFVKSSCEFNVTLFDKSCTEIDYPVKAKRINKGNNEEEGSVIHRASSSFQSRIPSFRIVMQKSNVTKRSVLVIPPSFARKHLINKSGDAVFSLSDGRTWRVKYYTKKTLGYPITRVEHLGWSKFAKDISLRVGDVCVFELIDNEKTIFRVVKNGNTSSCCPKKSIDPSGAKEFAKKRSTSVNPSFQVQISSQILEHGQVYVPRSFMKSIGQETKETMLKVKNRWWPVKFIFSPIYGSDSFSAGWSAFAMENSLKSGDVCTFELIDCGENPLISVSIVKVSGPTSVGKGDGKEAVPKLPGIEKTRSEISGKCLTRSSILRKRKQESSFSFSQPSKKANKFENIIEITGKGANDDFTASGSTKRSMGDKSINGKGDQKPSCLHRLEAVEKCTSENDFSK